MHRLWSYIRVKMWTSITTGVNNFFPWVSEGNGLERSNGLKGGLLMIGLKQLDRQAVVCLNTAV